MSIAPPDQPRPDQPKPPRPTTPRGVQPILRRNEKGTGWVWRYTVRWKDPGSGRRKVEEFNTVREAEDFRAHLRIARRQGVIGDLTRGETTVTDFVEQSWWPKYAAKNLQRNTLKTYAAVWNKHLDPRIGHLQLRQLTAPAVQQLREVMEADGVGDPTIRRALAILQGICKHAITTGEIKVNPVREVEKPAVGRETAIVAVGPDQVEQLRLLLLHGYTFLAREIPGARKPKKYKRWSDGWEVLPHTAEKQPGDREIRRGPDPQAALLVSLIGSEGLRPEEVLALETRHVGKQTLLIEQKNIDGTIVAGQKTGRRRRRSHRSPDLYGPVREDLLAHIRTITGGDVAQLRQYLFARPSDGQAWREHDYRNWRRLVFKPAIKHLDLPITRPYHLRHSCASLLIASGMPLTEVAAHMGHSVAMLSDTYAHLIAELKGQPPVPVEDQIRAARAKHAKEEAS